MYKLQHNVPRVDVLDHLDEVVLIEFVFQVDTNLQSPDDFVVEGVPGVKSTYNVAPFSSILLEAK